MKVSSKHRVLLSMVLVVCACFLWYAGHIYLSGWVVAISTILIPKEKDNEEATISSVSKFWTYGPPVVILVLCIPHVVRAKYPRVFETFESTMNSYEPQIMVIVWVFILAAYVGHLINVLRKSNET